MRVGYIARRVGTFGLIVWLALTVNFVLPRVTTPAVSRPRGNLAHQLLLDRPLWEQYVGYLGDLAHFNLNYSLSSYPNRVSDQIGTALPWTLAVLGMASLLAWVLGTLLGAALGWRSRAKIITYLFPPLMILSAAPYFIIGLLLLYCFAFRVPMFPSGGGYTEGSSPTLSAGFALDVAWHAALPALSIVLVSIATWAISMRALVVGFDGEDFLLFAEAKGLRSWTIFVRYALRNALLPQLTGLGIALGQIVSGSVLVEAVFHYPGLGGLLYRAILTRDFNLEQGVVLVMIVSIALAALVIDLAYPLIDPRGAH